jgi:putative FmdB family regulatory protein
MPLYEYQCECCGAIAERLIRPETAADTVACGQCGSAETVRLLSRVNFKLHRKPKYSEEFLGKAMPAMKGRPETAPHFAEGGGSDEAKMFAMGEQIGERIDRVLQTRSSKP